MLAVGPRSPDDLRAITDGAGPWVPVVILVAWIALVPLLVSGTVLAAATGLLLGAGVGTGIAVLGATGGAGVAFLVARGGAGDAAQRLAGRRLRSVEQRLTHRPILGIAVLRAAPGMPAGPLAYAAGLSRVRLRHFLTGMALGGAPRIFAYAALGGSLANLNSPLGWAAGAVLAALTMLGVAAAWCTRRRVATI